MLWWQLCSFCCRPLRHEIAAAARAEGKRKKKEYEKLEAEEVHAFPS
jgi:hypothetical protein